MKSALSIFVITIFFLRSYSQNLEYRSVDYYLDIVNKLEIEELKKAGLINDSLRVVSKYREQGKESFNTEAFEKYADIKIHVLQSIFKDYLYQQHLEYKDEVYVLYFSMAGLDDTEWQILRWTKNIWDQKDKISMGLVEDCKKYTSTKSDSAKCNFEPIVFNYDEGPKNLDSVKIFIINEYLVMERGGLYHSLYDLNKHEVIINEESPWNASGGQDKEELNKWIKTNLHDKIAQIIYK